MKQQTPQEWINELDEMYENHSVALVAFGNSAYAYGYKKGVIHGAIAFGVGVLAAGAVSIYKSVKRDKKHKQSNDGEA